MRRYVIIAALIVFTAYTLSVMAGHGVLGFVSLAGREPWALQVLLDLLVMLALFSTWVARDARKRGLTAWPWILASMTMGSVGALAYLAYREVRSRPATQGPGPTTGARA